MEPGEKPLYWVGASKRDLMAMPAAVIRHIGTALSVAQYGGKHPDAKPWKGLGPGIFEVVSDFDTNTFVPPTLCGSSVQSTSCIAFRRSRHSECARRRRTWN
jgi:hypothetical protein